MDIHILERTSLTHQEALNGRKPEKTSILSHFRLITEQRPLALEDGRLEVSPDAVGMANVAGTFSLQDYTAPKGSSVSWGFSQRKPESAFAVYDEGLFCVSGTGVAVVTATQNNSDGSSEASGFCSSPFFQTEADRYQAVY